MGRGVIGLVANCAVARRGGRMPSGWTSVVTLPPRGKRKKTTCPCHPPTLPSRQSACCFVVRVGIAPDWRFRAVECKAPSVQLAQRSNYRLSVIPYSLPAVPTPIYIYSYNQQLFYLATIRPGYRREREKIMWSRNIRIGWG